MTPFAGCGNLGVADELATQLEYEGHQKVNVTLVTELDGDVVTITTHGSRTLDDEAAAGAIALTVWSTLPRQFDLVEISSGRFRQTASYQQLGERYGPRDSSLDERTIAGSMTKIVTPVAITAGGLLLGAGIVWLILRQRRRRHHGRHELGWPADQDAGHDSRGLAPRRVNR